MQIADCQKTASVADVPQIGLESSNIIVHSSMMVNERMKIFAQSHDDTEEDVDGRACCR